MLTPMGWTHDTGYDPAYAHEGYPAAVLDDGTDTAAHTAAHTAAMRERVSGWRAACDCGWRGGQFWPRAEYPGSASTAPAEVDGFDTDTGAFAEWSAHLQTELPGLAVHDAAQDLEWASRRLDQAVADARRAGASWTVIGVAAGLTRQSAYQRWSPNSERAAKTTTSISGAAPSTVTGAAPTGGRTR